MFVCLIFQSFQSPSNWFAAFVHQISEPSITQQGYKQVEMEFQHYVITVAMLKKKHQKSQNLYTRSVNRWLKKHLFLLYHSFCITFTNILLKIQAAFETFFFFYWWLGLACSVSGLKVQMYIVCLLQGLHLDTRKKYQLVSVGNLSLLDPLKCRTDPCCANYVFVVSLGP